MDDYSIITYLYIFVYELVANVDISFFYTSIYHEICNRTRTKTSIRYARDKDIEKREREREREREK